VILSCNEGKDDAYLLELLDSTLVNTTALVDQVTSGSRLAGIDMADNDDVDVLLLSLTHFDGIESFGSGVLVM
jgi:DNA-binding response OmpR family regulator